MVTNPTTLKEQERVEQPDPLFDTHLPALQEMATPAHPPELIVHNP